MNAGPWLPVPPAGYGGIENVVATLVPELRARGVRVILATVGQSELEADGYVTRHKVGARNFYEIHPDRPLRHPPQPDLSVGDLLHVLLGKSPPARPRARA